MVGVFNTPPKVSLLDVDGHLDMGAYNLLTDMIEESSSGNGVDIDGVVIKDDVMVTLEAVGGSAIAKKVSDNLRNSHDAEHQEASTGVVYVKCKTMTFTHGIKGTLRVKFAIREPADTYAVYGRVYKNGVALGAAQTTSSSTYSTKSEDIDVGSIAAGETLELWGKAEHASANVYLQEFRCYYDNEGNAAVVVNS